MVDILGATAVVTGGQRGLGKSIVTELLERGASTVYATSRSPIPSDDPRIISTALDVTDVASVTTLSTEAASATIVINNAGLLGGASLLQDSFTDIREVFDTNYFGPLRVARAFAPVLAANGGGALVDISSVLAWFSGSGAYGDSKAALWSATNSLRLEMEAQHTLVIGVHLGYTDTPMIADLDFPKNDPADVARCLAHTLRHSDVLTMTGLDWAHRRGRWIALPGNDFGLRK